MEKKKERRKKSTNMGRLSGEEKDILSFDVFR